MKEQTQETIRAKLDIPIEISRPKVISEDEDSMTVELRLLNLSEIENDIFLRIREAVANEPVAKGKQIVRSGASQLVQFPIHFTLAKREEK